MPTVFNTREFRRSDGPGLHNAVSAWQAGYTGAGVTIAVIDSGIDRANPEFAGRIAAASRDLYPVRDTLSGPFDHGTRVAQVAAAARDDQGILGIAWNATILALRSDQPGSCDGPEGNAGCNFTDETIAAAVTYAADNGARIVNISLGGGSAGTVLTNAVRAAVARGVLVVVAAGNEGLDGPTGFTTRLSEAGGGGVLVVGAIDADGGMTDFSNRAGNNAASYLTALGEAICCVYQDGKIYVDENGYLHAFSGTSFSTPQVSGAAALLAQAFPNLTGQQLAAILLESAFDAGATGPDPVFGSGILDIARAFQPLGKTSLAGQALPIALADTTVTGSAAMGDALLGVSLPVLVTDKYSRAFAADLGAGLRGAGLALPLSAAMTAPRRAVGLARAGASLLLSYTDARDRQGVRPDTALGRQNDPAIDGPEQGQLFGARAAFALTPATQLSLAYRHGGDSLAGGLRGREEPAFLLSASPSSGAGLTYASDVAIGLRQKVRSFGITLIAEDGETLHSPERNRPLVAQAYEPREGVQRYGVVIDRGFGSVETAAGLSWLAEHRTLLGARFHDAFGLAGADTLFLDAEAAWHIAPRLRLGAAVRRGVTRARAGGIIGSDTRLTSDAWSLDIAHDDVFVGHDVLALRLAQPLRVSSGGLALSLPDAWDYDTLTAHSAERRVSLVPHGREVMAELAWSGRLLSGEAAASLFYRRDPGHHADVPTDTGLALRWSARF